MTAPGLSLVPRAEKRSVQPKELAVHARSMLKAAFPGVVFSVTCGRSGGSVRTSWTDGPTESQVDAVLGVLEGRSFDGMDDSNSYRDVTLPTGEVVRAYAFMMTTRHASEALNTRMAAVFGRAVGFPLSHRTFSVWRDTYAHRLAWRFDATRSQFVGGRGDAAHEPIEENEADFTRLAPLRAALTSDVWRDLAAIGEVPRTATDFERAESAVLARIAESESAWASWIEREAVRP